MRRKRRAERKKEENITEREKLLQVGGRKGMEGSIRGPFSNMSQYNISVLSKASLLMQMMQMIGTCSKEEEWAEVFRADQRKT